MRILYHHRTRAEDGQAVHIRALQRAFREEGHEVHEVALVRRDDGGEPADAAGRWRWVERLPRFALELAEYAYGVTAKARLVRAGRDFAPDFVYERYAFGNTGGVQAARRLGVPLVLEVNSPMVLELERTRGLSFPGLAQRVERFVFRSADLVCVVSGVLRDMLIAEGVRPERLLVTPNAVHPELYRGPDPARARADLGLPPRVAGELVLGFVGYHRSWHRLDLVLPFLAGSGRRARLVLVGAGPADAELAAAARAAGVAERVHFAGPRPHESVPGLLAAMDVALVPAINPYASPLKLHEYLAAGLAVVAPDQPNLREVLEDGANGLLFPPGDARALSAALARLLADEGLRARLGAAALRTIEERDLTWRGNARRVVEAVERRR